MSTKKDFNKFANKDPRFARRIAVLGKNLTFDGPPKTWTSQRSIEASKASTESLLNDSNNDSNKGFEEA